MAELALVNDVLRGLEIDGVITELRFTRPATNARAVDITATLNGSGILIMADEDHDLVRVVWRRREDEVTPDEIADIVRSWATGV